MPINVLVVDDSAFFRRRIKEILEKHPDLKVVGFADNGKYAIEKAKELNPDVITMDYEMPVMDGISAVKIIMQETPTPILMFSSLSFEGARVTLDALEAGALDYLPKSFESMSSDAQQ
ncbi:MAG: response regulator, partial [Pseudomonadales bacterium]|nr:response regulator [Pseudomonadales bacterium]